MSEEQKKEEGTVVLSKRTMTEGVAIRAVFAAFNDPSGAVASHVAKEGIDLRKAGVK